MAKAEPQDPISFEGVEIPPGGCATVQIPLPHLYSHSEINMPVHVIHGTRPGPRLFVSGAIHGDELNGVEIIRRVLQLPAMGRIRGTLVAVPVVNVFGFHAQSRYLPDRRDLNRMFPGSAKGSLAGRLADLFLTRVVARCTHGIDLHTGSLGRDNFPQIRCQLSMNPEIEAMARAFGAPVILDANLREGSLRHVSAKAYGIPVVVYEAGEALRFDPVSIRAGVRGVVSVMRAIGLLAPTRPKKKVWAPHVAHSSTWVRAPSGGIHRDLVRMGDQVTKGQVLGEIGDPLGEETAQVTASVSGIVIGRSNLPLVHEGDALFHIARFEGPDEEAAETVDAFQDRFEMG